MLQRLLFLSLISYSLLHAVPSFSQMKEAVKANPELLNTPQAKAMMKEKGVTKEDVRKQLVNDEMSSKVTDVKDIENNIDIVETNETNKLGKRLNPFTYKTNEELRVSLNSKHQLLTHKKLTRYSDRFYANKNIIDSASLPTPDDYTISTGDILELHIYGDRSEMHELEVKNDGSVELEFIGPVRVGGLSYLELQKHLEKRLKSHYKSSSFKIILSKYSSIQVTLIGDVKYPGIYNLSSFSTAKDLLVESKGVRENASIRDIVIKRNGKSVASLDFYDLLFEGKDLSGVLLKHGDIVIIKKAKKLVGIDGYVNSASVFELKENETLTKLIEYAGGMKADASKRHIKIDRYSENSIFETFNISYRKAKNFKMKDGDRVYIYKLDDSADRNVNIYGNIIRPGSYRIDDNATLNKLLKSHLSTGLKKFFLPETYFAYGILKRYSDTLSYETISFNLEKVLAGKQTLTLHPKDEIFIFSKNDIGSSEYITTKGDILTNDGKMRYFSGMTIRDAIFAAGTDGVMDERVRVTTINTPDHMPKTSFYSFEEDANVKLSPYDEVEVYDYYETHLLQPVSIKGEVVNPITVFYETGMTLANLLDSSGGITPMAFLNKVEIVRYYIDEKNNRDKKVIYVSLKDINPQEYVVEAYDEVTIYKIPNWSDKRVVTLKGEVKFPGDYTIGNSEKLSSLIKRAGGYTNEAFVEGAVFTRDSIRVKQIEQYNASLAKIKRELALYNAMPANSKKMASSGADTSTLNDVILEAKKYQPVGRISMKLQKDLEVFSESEYDLILKDKDTLFIPGHMDTVTVFGEVFNPTSFVYSSNMDLEDYITLASGVSRAADSSNIYVIHADGTSEPADSGWFSSSVEIAQGDTIVVPVYIKETDSLDLWDSVSRILASFAITAATLNTLGIM